MSFPPSLTTRTVKGRFVTYPDGVAACGEARIVLTSTMQGPTDNAFVVQFDRTIKFYDGDLTVLLPVNDDPDWTPSKYRIVVTVDGKDVIRETFQISVNDPDPVYLADILNIPAPTPREAYIVAAAKGVAGGVATLGNDGKIVAEQFPEVTADTVPWDGITGKPTTFTPSAHTHPTSDVTGLDTALADKVSTSALTTGLAGKADLVAGVLPTSQLPSIAVVDFLGTVSTQAAMLALTGQKGDWAIRSDLGQAWVITGSDPTQLASWTAMPIGTAPVQTVNGQTGTVVLAKSDIGLGNVDNTSDANKPVSTAQLTALNLKAPLASPTFTGTVAGVTAAMVGLSNVDNTSDASKPVSTAQLTALNLKAPLASPTFTGTVAGITAAMVGLGNVDNTADAAKPVSTAQQTALNLKAPLASPTFTGTVAGITATMVGLGNVNNTADTAKPVSTAQQTALDLKAPLASPTFTGTVAGVTASMVGLGNVDNTSDAAKPLSTAALLALSGFISPTDHGLAGWTFPPDMVQASTVLPTAGLSYVVRLRVLAATVSAINIHIVTAGATLTNCFATLHNDAGAILGAGAVTANQSTAWQSGGFKSMALSVAQGVTAGDFYKIRFWVGSGGTLPALSRAINSSTAITNAGLSAPNFRYATADSSMSTLALAPNNIGTMTGGPTAWWVSVTA